VSEFREVEHARETLQPVRYFPVPVSKFVVLSLLSFGFYEIYWFYKSWAYIRARDGSRISPVLRTVFQPFTFPALMADVRRNLRAGPSRVTSIVLAVVFFVLSIVGLFPDPYSLPGLFTFVCFLPAVRLIRSINSPTCEHPPYGWSTRNRAFVVLAAPFFAGTIASMIAFIPSSQVEPGWMVWGRSRQFFATSGVLLPGETIVYFYAGGFLSFADDGNLLTDKRVLHYDTNRQTGELVIEKAAFAEIDFTKSERGNWRNPTVLTVVRKDGSSFDLHLSATEERDRAFIDRLERLRWQSRGEQDAARKAET
jgi:hypothetical protein